MKTLADVQAGITKLEREVVGKKELANQLAEMGGLPLVMLCFPVALLVLRVRVALALITAGLYLGAGRKTL